MNNLFRVSTICLFATVQAGIAVPSSAARNVGVGFAQSASKGAYRAQVRSTAVKQPDYLLHGRWWGGGGRSLPEAAMSEITIHRNGRKVYVPRSAYADLSNINKVWVVTTAKGCEVRFEGGDAHSGYFGKLSLVGDTVTERVVRSGEFPNHDWERTIYTVKDIEN